MPETFGCRKTDVRRRCAWILRTTQQLDYPSNDKLLCVHHTVADVSFSVTALGGVIKCLLYHLERHTMRAGNLTDQHSMHHEAQDVVFSGLANRRPYVPHSCLRPILRTSENTDNFITGTWMISKPLPSSSTQHMLGCASYERTVSEYSATETTPYHTDIKLKSTSGFRSVCLHTSNMLVRLSSFVWSPSRNMTVARRTRSELDAWGLQGDR